MDAKQLFEAGRLADATATQEEQVKANPTDAGARTFLFELYCFAGELDRAEKQLDVIGHEDVQAEAVAQIYRNILNAEKQRRRTFADGLEPKFFVDPPAYVRKHLQAINRIREGNAAEATELLEQSAEVRPELSGELNGEAFEGFRDCDDLLAPVLEVFLGREYFWLPFEQIVELELTPPKTPRDLLWATFEATLTDENTHRGFLPVLYAGSHEHGDDQVRIGRMTDWNADGDGPVTGVGQRLFLAGEDDHPVLEVRSVSIRASA